MSTASITWGCCNSDTDNKNYKRCTRCNKAFHYECIFSFESQESSNNILSRDWKCPMCKNKKRNNDNTPIRSVDTTDQVHVQSKKRSELILSSDQYTSSPLKHNDIRDLIKEVLKEELSNFAAQINQNLSRTINTELQLIKDDIRDFQESFSYLNSQYEDLQKEHKSLSETTQTLVSQNLAMQNTIKSLCGRLNQVEQHARASNIEIQCVPESKNENLVSIIKQLSTVVSCTIDDEKILHCSRAVKSKCSKQRPRAIVVQFTSPLIRDNFLAAVTRYNKLHPEDKLNSSHLKIAGDKKPIYVMEHLSPANKALHSAARQLSKEKNYKYVWIKNGRIYIRRNEYSDYTIIKDMSCLEKIV